MTAELAELREFFSVDSDAVLPSTFTERMEAALREDALTRQQINDLQAKRDRLEHALRATVAPRRPLSLSKLNLTLQLRPLESLFADFEKQLPNIEREVQNKVAAYNQAHNRRLADLRPRVAALRQELADLKREGDRLAESRRDISRIPIAEPDEAASNKARSNLTNVVRLVRTNIKKRLVSFDRTVSVNSDLINKRLADLKLRIDRVLQKIEAWRRMPKTRKSSGAVGPASDSENLRLMLRIARRTALVEKVSEAMKERFAKQAAAFKASLDAEEAGNKLAGDTGLTMSALRKAVIRLLREIFRIQFEGARQIEQDESEMQKLNAAASHT
jgi:Skp family chaperone for outer membrane proteins